MIYWAGNHSCRKSVKALETCKGGGGAADITW